MTSWPRGLLAPVLVAALVALGACAAPTAPETPPAAAGEHPPGHTEEQAEEQAEGHAGGHQGSTGLELWAVQSGPLGVVVTDGGGRLVYRSDRDSATPPTTTCVDACATAWEPVISGATPPELLGVDPEVVGTVARPDGAPQVTIGGWPVYFRAGESGGLVTEGADGTDGVWFVVAPTGAKADAA